MPFSTACSTPLSNFEAGQNYKDVVDPAGILSFSSYFAVLILFCSYEPCKAQSTRKAKDYLSLLKFSGIQN